MKKISEKQKKDLEQFIRTSTGKQEALRAQAILLLEEGGMRKKPSLFTGYSRAQAFRIKRKFFSGGTRSLQDKRKGKPKELLAKFAYHKPERVYDKHSEEEAWKTEAKPKLEKFLKEEDTVILAEDEMVLTTETTIQKVWLPEGEFPKIVYATGGRKKEERVRISQCENGKRARIQDGISNDV